MNNSKIYTLILITLTVVLFILDLSIGAEFINPKESLSSLLGLNTEHSVIIDNFRLPRVLTAILSGIALSLSGLIMQTTFRNPLAGPYVLGISGGAGLGVAIVTLSAGLFSGYTFTSNWSITIAAWIGAGLVLLVIFYASLKVKDIMTLLVFGILLGAAISAIIGILQYFSEAAQLKTFVLWTFGNLESVTKSQLPILIISVLAGVIISLTLMKSLNGLLLGEEYATTMGINIKTTRILIFTATGILTGTITAFCGPIGFLGIAVPHVVRMIYKTNDHKVLIPSTILFGSIVMLISDIISQLPGTEYKLPINSITALFGIPIIVWLIIKNRRISL